MKKLRFGIVGTGTIAHRFANALKNVPNACLAAVASRTNENAKRFSDEFSIPFRFSSYESMAKSNEIDVAYIAVPHSGHCECSCLMMNNGKNVICEKPLAVNALQAEKMIECAKKNNVFLMEAMWGSFVDGTKTLKKLVSDGTLGEIKGTEAKFSYTFDDDELDVHTMKNEHGGGALLDVGVYALYFSDWYIKSCVEEINAFADIYNGVDAHTAILIKYANGAISDLSCGVLLRKPNEGFVYGTEGYVKVPRFYAPETIEVYPNDGESYILKTPYIGNGFEEQIIHTCECIEKGLKESPVNTFEKSLFIAKQMDDIRKLTGVHYPQDNI